MQDRTPRMRLAEDSTGGCKSGAHGDNGVYELIGREMEDSDNLDLG